MATEVKQLQRTASKARRVARKHEAVTGERMKLVQDNVVRPSKTKSIKRKRKRSSDVVTHGREDGIQPIDEPVTGDGEEDQPRQDDVVPTIAVKYVPPHLRQNTGGSEEMFRLQRRIRGLLNRLSEANVESITTDVSTIFQAHGRHMVTELIVNEIIGACCEGPRGNDQYAAVFAAFVAGMAATVGIDFGAKFVAALAKSLEDQYRKEENLAVRNLALLLSHVYIFHLLSSELLFDILGVLCKRFEELDVATILTILQSCGMVLRGDDPVAMKDFILSIQQRTAELKTVLAKNTDNGGLNKRVQFMLDMICDIKNNKRQNKDSVPHARLKRWLQKLSVEDVQLRAVTWAKLLDPVQKGQWWLPSAACREDLANARGELVGTMDAGAVETDKMLQLAASQRMNTDARRAVFCMVMSGEDYMDAFEKILRLKLPGTQDREILRVIVECCLQEKLYNKYYALLASKLCCHDKKHKFTMQYCLWDHFKQLETMELRRSANLARFLAHMISSSSLSLSVLKAVDFTDSRAMTPKVVMYFRILLDSLIIEHSEETVWNSFSRIAASPKFAELRDGLGLFFHQYMKSAMTKDQEGQEGIVKRYKLAKKALKNFAGVNFK